MENEGVVPKKIRILRIVLERLFQSIATLEDATEGRKQQTMRIQQFRTATKREQGTLHRIERRLRPSKGNVNGGQCGEESRREMASIDELSDETPGIAGAPCIEQFLRMSEHSVIVTKRWTSVVVHHDVLTVK